MGVLTTCGSGRKYKQCCGKQHKIKENLIYKLEDKVQQKLTNFDGSYHLEYSKSIIFEYEQEIKEIKKQIENENQILFQLKKDYKNLSDEAEKIRKLS